MRDGYLSGALSPQATQRQIDAFAAYVTAGGSVQDAAALVGIRPSTVKRHLADLRARSGLTTEQLIYAGRAGGWLVVPNLEPGSGTTQMVPRPAPPWRAQSRATNAAQPWCACTLALAPATFRALPVPASAWRAWSGSSPTARVPTAVAASARPTAPGVGRNRVTDQRPSVRAHGKLGWAKEGQGAMPSGMG